tara:strand:+ start:404 stop:1024 length:621 start_codon:yes stop_codon:yes gene_type:complete
MSDKLITPNCTLPEFWDSKYNNNEDQWDIGGPTPIIVNWFKRIKSRKKIIVPGCGNGHDALYLAKMGHDVYAVDFSIKAINSLKCTAKKNNLKITALHKDFFCLEEYYGYFDILVEYTFFCAILPEQRNQYILESYNLLNKKGKFFGILLPINKKEKEGPPFSINLNDTIKAFKKKYKLIECSKSEYSIKPRKDKEIFILMSKLNV